MLNVLSVENTYTLLLEKFSDFGLNIEKVDIINSLNRIIGCDIVCPVDVPPFNRSTMDGYAVKAKDTFGASSSIPSIFEKCGDVFMGEPAKHIISDGEAVYIPTGGMLPEGSDSVVMIEYTDLMDSTTLLVETSVAPGENVVFRGEDLKKGNILFKKGHVLRAQDIGVLASVGIKYVDVLEKPKVAVISTGNELVDIDEDISGGKIRDINTYSIAASVINDNFEYIPCGIAKDSFNELKTSIENALNKADIVLLSGGSSIGVLDLTYKVIKDLNNAEVFLHGIAVKPGKPTIAAKVGNKIVFGLPGHPVSAFMIYKVIVSQFINNMLKIEKQNICVEAEFSSNYPSSPGRDEYLPVKLETQSDRKIASPIYGKSSMMTILSDGDGYVHISSLKEGIYKGEKVKVFLF